VWLGIIECMCDESVSEVSGASDAALVDEITDAARAEAAAAARRFAAIAELTERRCSSELAMEREYWACDGWDSAAAEIGAAQMISHRATSTLMHQALALRHRLPKVGALLAAGAITAPLATLVCWRTHLIDDPTVLGAVDAEMAAAITNWGQLSSAKLESTVDAVIDRHDPAAVLAYRAAARGRDIGLGKQDDTSGTTSLWGRLLVTDGELLKRRLEAMANAVCREDPRTLGERRSDAMGILMAGGDTLPCRCEHPDCPNTSADARAEAIVIHVLTDQRPGDPTGPGGPADPTGTGPAPAGTAATPDTTSPSCPRTAVIAGGPSIPAPLLAELARMGALTRTVADPATLCAETGYRPSAALARFVRSRDLTCCFHGCDRPAEYCDLDHTIPWGRGPTHPGNLKCLCRKHHLLKTFWTGSQGWTDEQEPDGTIVWTAPTGHQYRSPPGSRLLFPAWNTTTPVKATAAIQKNHSPDRGLAMPLRKRTRSAERAARIQGERQRNQDTLDNNPAPF
jgi:hypothetical protein